MRHCLHLSLAVALPLALACGALLVASGAPPAPPVPSDPEAIELSLAVVARPSPDHHPPSLRARLVNRSGRKQVVMPVLDGSIVKWRYPHYELEVVDEAGEPVPGGGIARCANVNPWRRADFVELAPDKALEVRLGMWGYPLAPGEYRVRLRYHVRRSLGLDGASLGGPEPGVRELMDRAWEGTAVSRWVTLTVHPHQG